MKKLTKSLKYNIFIYDCQTAGDFKEVAEIFDEILHRFIHISINPEKSLEFEEVDVELENYFKNFRIRFNFELSRSEEFNENYINCLLYLFNNDRNAYDLIDHIVPVIYDFNSKDVTYNNILKHFVCALNELKIKVGKTTDIELFDKVYIVAIIEFIINNLKKEV